MLLLLLLGIKMKKILLQNVTRIQVGHIWNFLTDTVLKSKFSFNTRFKISFGGALR